MLAAAVSLTTACTLTSTSSQDEAATNKPNVIWVVLEDVSLDLAVYGTPEVKTPNLDKLATQGTLYTKAFATSSVCSPSRSSFFTGMHQTSIGAHNHRSHLDDGYQLPSHVKLLSEYMRDAGYYNLLLGPKQKTDFNFYTPEPVFDAQDGEIQDASGAYTHAPLDFKILSQAGWKKYLAEGQGKPFFAQINYSETHRTFVVDKQNPVDAAKVELPVYYPDHDITRRDWALYLETVQTVDTKVGLLFEELKQAGVLDNSIVFIFGDHGRAMLRDKQWLYDGSLEVPLIVLGKGIEKGVVSDELVSLIDLMPTTMSLVDIPVPDYIEGQVFIGKNKQQRDYVYAQRDRCDETDDRIRSVRDSRFHYIRNFKPEQPYTQFNAYKKLNYPVFTLMQVLYKQGKLTKGQAAFMADTRPVEELYDTVNDPDEINNLAKDPRYIGELRRLRNELVRWQAETGDQGMHDETPEVISYWDDFFAKHYPAQMKKKGLSPDISDEDYLKWWDEELKRQGK